MHAECITYTEHVDATEESRADPYFLTPEPYVPTSANPAWHSEAIPRPPKTREVKGRMEQQPHVFLREAKATLQPEKAGVSPT